MMPIEIQYTLYILIDLELSHVMVLGLAVNLT